MINGLVFILHGPADEGYAVRLAAALAPFVALPMAVYSNGASRQTEYGGGATCVLLLGDGLEFRSEAVARALQSASTVICSRPAVAMPPELARHTRVCLQDEVDATALALREAVAAKQSEKSGQTDGPRRAALSPSLAKRGSEVRETGKHSMVVRSAWGLAATIAVASIAAPAIGDRAGASSVTGDVNPTNRADGSSTLQTIASSNVAPPGDEQDVQPVEPPHLVALLDHLDRINRPETASVLAYTPEETAPALEQPIFPEGQTAGSTSSEADAMLTVDAVGSSKQATAPASFDSVKAPQTATTTLEAPRIK